MAIEAQVWLEPGNSPSEPDRALISGLQLTAVPNCDPAAWRLNLRDLLPRLIDERVEQLTLSRLDDELASLLESLSGLQRFTVLGDYHLSEQGLLSIIRGSARSRRLIELRLRGRNLAETPWSAPVWQALTELRALRELELQQVAIDIAALGGIAKRCDQLRDLTLSGCDFSHSTSALPVFPELVTLDLSGSRVASGQLVAVAQMPKLQVLLLERLTVGTGWECGSFAKFDSVRRLSLRGTPCSLDDALQLVNLRRLRVLDLNDSGLSQQELEAVQRSAPPELRLVGS